ncbi:MAG: hypothetical protein COU66_02570 [Candidatus Pacebacteria bacterium CG10_big_fil_rev_8_21_14_0_10_44_11]|nr:MAG: hypothetical protein COU66_02570 [Candidatus Pacebacteria bacterium CG10_big_fil_rev_8_21_14_0_10_44_11]
MSAQVVIPLAEFLHYSRAVIGHYGVQLAELDHLALPLPTTIAIPQSALLAVLAEQNVLNTLLAFRLSATTDPAERYRLKQLIKHQLLDQTLPDWFSQPILSSYHNQFQRGFVRLLPADTVPYLDQTQFEHIQGDANLFESLLAFWAKWVESQLDVQQTIKQSTLVPTAILIQAQVQAIAAGTAYSEHPVSGNKTQVFIRAIKGCPEPEIFESGADEFAVDTRTWNVVYRAVQAQTQRALRTQDGLERLAIPPTEQQQSSLTDQECLDLAQLVQQLKRHQLAQAEVEWELSPRGFVLTQVKQFETVGGGQTSKPVRTQTKLYISAGNPQKAQLLTAGQPDGVGVLRSEYSYAQFGIHPGHIVHSRQREVLERQLVAVIQTYQAAVNYQRVIFRTQNLTSAENAALAYSTSHEPVETNPFLGFRGGLKLVSHPELLTIELTALRRVLEKSAGQLGYLLSFVRTPEELSTLIQHISQAGLTNQPQFELWWQINTPENVLNLSAYPLHHLAGISVNVKTLQALLYGVDPDNPEIFERYQFDPAALITLLEKIAAVRDGLRELRSPDQPLLLHLHLEDFSRELVAQAVKLRYDGIVVKPRAVVMLRAVVAECETAAVNQRIL